MSRFALTGAAVFDGEAIRDDIAVIVADGTIESVIPGAEVPSSVARRRLSGGVLAPGFIDAQVNGGGGALLNGDPSIDGVRKIAAAHREYGTTGLLPTVITDAPEVMHKAIEAVREARRLKVPGVLGVHIEGPFIDPKRRGAHDEQFIRAITATDVEYLRALDCGTVLLTLAPSVVSTETIAALSSAGIIVSLGHSEASAPQALAALKAGARGFTHLFNAMSQLGHQAPGMVGAALSDPDAFCGLIADGRHVDPVALRVALVAKPRGKLFLVTDAMPSAARGPNAFLLQNRKVEVKGGRLELADGTLAGSNLTMDEAVRYCCTTLGVPLDEALRMASLYPATFLTLEKQYGRIAPGYAADLVHLSDDLHTRKTWIAGVNSEE